MVHAPGVNHGLVDGLVFLDFHLSCGAIIDQVVRLANQNAYPSSIHHPSVGVCHE
jgi:hypothetical protein